MNEKLLKVVGELMRSVEIIEKEYSSPTNIDLTNEQHGVKPGSICIIKEREKHKKLREIVRENCKN